MKGYEHELLLKTEKESDEVKQLNQYSNNYSIIEQDIQWLESIIIERVECYTKNHNLPSSILSPPNIDKIDSHYTNFLNKYSLTVEERIILLIALASDVRPEIFNHLIIQDKVSEDVFIQFGGIKSQTYRGFLPTVKTALFILGGKELSEQMRVEHFFDNINTLYAKRILKEIPAAETDPKTNKLLSLTDSARCYITTGQDIHYEYSLDFPANRLTTELEWEDLVLDETTQHELKELLAWIKVSDRLIDYPNTNKRIQPGYRSIFHGYPGTGKTLTVALIGKRVNKPVYRINLSQLVSKYVGETEKNLERIFNITEGRDWILFFDEGDALFGKRTDVESANDRFANQETAYLLQRIENLNSIVILATNKIENFDEAFNRRFQSMVYFRMPDYNKRLRIWEMVITDNFRLDESVDINRLAKNFNISGGDIVNIMRYAVTMALLKNTEVISKEDILEGIKQERMKESKYCKIEEIYNEYDINYSDS